MSHLSGAQKRKKQREINNISVKLPRISGFLPMSEENDTYNKVCLNTKDDCHDSEKTIETDAVDACLGHSQSHGNINKDEIIGGNNDADAEHSQQLRIVDTEIVCKTMSRPTTAVADTIVTVATADTVDAGSCHNSHDNFGSAKETILTNNYDSIEEIKAETMSTHNNDNIQSDHSAKSKFDAALWTFNKQDMNFVNYWLVKGVEPCRNRNGVYANSMRIMKKSKGSTKTR